MDFQSLVSDPDYQALPPERQTAIRQDFFNTHVANDKDFQSLPPDRQAAVKQDIFGQGQEPATFTKTAEPQHGAVVRGLENIFPTIAQTTKTIGKAAITQPEGGFFNVGEAPAKTVQNLIDVAKGAASGATAGIYQPSPPTTEAQAARETLGQVGGFAVPFAGVTRAATTAGLPAWFARMLAGGVTGAAAPLVQGDIPGAVQQAVTGAGVVPVMETAARVPSAVLGTAGKVGQNLALRSQAKELGGATGILQKAGEQLTGGTSVTEAGGAVKAGQRAAGEAARAGVAPQFQAVNTVPETATIPNTVSDVIRDSLPEQGALSTPIAKKLNKLADDLGVAGGPTVGAGNLSGSTPEIRQQVLSALGVSARSNLPEATGYLERYLKTTTEAPAAATPPPPEPPAELPRINLTRQAPEPTAPTAPAAPTRPIQKIVMGESGVRGMAEPEPTRLPSQPPGPQPLAEGGASEQSVASRAAAREAAPEPNFAQRGLIGKDAIIERNRQLAQQQLEQAQQAQGMTPQPSGITLQDLAGRDQALNNIYRPGLSDADKRLIGIAKAAVKADMLRFKDAHPEHAGAVDSYFAGKEAYKQDVVPYHTPGGREPSGTTLRDITDVSQPSEVIDKLVPLPVEDIAKAKEGLAKGPGGNQVVRTLEDGITARMYQDATHDGVFNAKEFVNNFDTPKNVEKLQALLGDKYPQVERFKDQLKAAGADKQKGGGGMGHFRNMMIGQQLIMGVPEIVGAPGMALYHGAKIAGILLLPKQLQALAESGRGAKLLAQGIMETPGSARAIEIGKQIQALANTMKAGGPALGMAAAAQNARQQQENAPEEQQAGPTQGLPFIRRGRPRGTQGSSVR